jgi:hypothetical protein
MLLARNCERSLKIAFRFRGITLRRQQRNFACNAIDLSFAPPFLSRLHYGHRFTYAVPSVTELAKFGVGFSLHSKETKAYTALLPLTAMRSFQP